MKVASCSSSLTDTQWALIRPMLPAPKKRGRPPTDRRRVLDAILYVLRGGIQWRLMPAEFPPWQTVYHVFRQWIQDRHLGVDQRAFAGSGASEGSQTMSAHGLVLEGSAAAHGVFVNLGAG